MRCILVSIIIFLQSCQGFQGVADDVKDMVNNDAITVKVDKDAINEKTNVNVSIEVTNKEPVSQ